METAAANPGERAVRLDGRELLRVVHEDDCLLVLNKPAGLVCHPTKTDEWSSLVGRIRLYLGNANSVRLIHRLDRKPAAWYSPPKRSKPPAPSAKSGRRAR